ncbi:carbohydrate ABC transporter permease [Polymorphospora rubra]|uniref:Sugar ABC transporter permease n=1 Tax=Polymorphospora rubra TaxID=338584 RepID=A0A810NFI0_9ACTN|nr:sugar ABC transporter permease [Polymorphospora rubra]BCJ70203.1 sugar ABC transporter permease [Polymorphospora rubra]
MSRRHNPSRAAQTLLFFLPGAAVFAYFGWWPILRSVLLSLQDTNLVDPARWVGLENFSRVLADPLLATSARNTLWFVALSLLIGFPLPLLVATAIAEVRRFGGLYRLLVYLPVAVPPVVAVLLWKWFYDPADGLFNTLLGLVGLGPYPWLQSSTWAMPSLVLEATWAGAGSAILIYLAALTGVSPELYDAAEVDGASVLRRFWHVTLPQMRGVILILLLLQVIGGMQVFTEPFVMTDGGPEDSTVTVLLLIFRYAFVYGDYGAAAAVSVLLAVVLSLLSAAYLRATRAWSTT